MFEENQRRENRAVRIDTFRGPIEGFLQISHRQRTLDELNQATRRFITVHTHTSPSIQWSFGTGPLAINKASVLFVRELAPPPPLSNDKFCNFTRSPIRVRVNDFEIEGFCHVPIGGDPMKRMEQGQHQFISLTTVLVTGPDGQSTAQFLAVNRAHIDAVQENQSQTEPEPDAVSSGTTSEA